MLEDAPGSRTFSKVSPNSHLKHVLSVNSLSSVRSTGRQWRIYQSRCSLVNVKHSTLCWLLSTTPTCGRQALISPSLSLFLTIWADVHICVLLCHFALGVVPSVPPCTEVAALLLGCKPPVVSSMSSDVLACLLEVPPCSGNYADRQGKPCHSSHWCYRWRKSTASI